MIARLKNEQGITLLETLATALILSFTMISLYIGILYADKQVQRNYHERVAILLASGELDWQSYYKSNYKNFDLFEMRTVTLDALSGGRFLNGQMSTSLNVTSENPFGLLVPFQALEIKVSWLEPGERNSRYVVVREDYY